MGTGIAARETLAYLMWCYSEGYVTREDREVGGGNWMGEPQPHPEDEATRQTLLAMADEILAELKATGEP